MQTSRPILSPRLSQRDAPAGTLFAATSVTDLLAATFDLCRARSRMEALSIPNGMGKTFFTDVYASKGAGEIAVARIPGTGGAAALEAVVGAVTPGLFAPVQPSFLDEDNVLEMPRALRIPRERLPTWLRWSFKAWRSTSPPGAHLLLIIDDLHLLRLPGSIDPFIRQIDEARKGLDIGVTYLGSEKLLLSKFHAAQTLDHSFAASGRVPSIRDAVDRLSDQTIFRSCDLTDQDITSFVRWLGYGEPVAARICYFRKARRLRPSLRLIKDLLDEAAAAAADGLSLLESLEQLASDFPPAPRAMSSMISRSAA